MDPQITQISQMRLRLNNLRHLRNLWIILFLPREGRKQDEGPANIGGWFKNKAG